MSYVPMLVINKKQLDKQIIRLEKEECDKGEDVKEVARFLIKVANYESINFDGLELVICTPEFTGFNLGVRLKLIELDVEYRTLSC